MKFKILDVQWHIGHQYEMLKFPFVQWSWLLQYKRKTFSHSQRGNLSKMFASVPCYQPGTYDAAILHLDQDCLSPISWDIGKGSIYREMDEIITDIPKIVIMHGTPFRPEARAPYNDRRWLVERLQQVLGSNKLIVNSYQAAREWECGSPIIHGLDASEWFCFPKHPRVVTTLSTTGMPAYYGRALLAEVKSELKRRDIDHCQIGVDFFPQSWDEYREIIGSSLLYFNPTRESPMPRARTEAMLSGACILTTAYHDEDTFIRDGVNGFLVNDNPKQIADLAETLICDPDRAIAIGQTGRDTARRLFGWDRFASEWLGLLRDVCCRAHGVPGLLCTSSDERDWTKRSGRWRRARSIHLSRL